MDTSINNSINNKRIAKNTLLLYIRMFFTMLVTIYTSRVILNVLGVTDFGIFNVVGGIIAMFGFINSAMSASTSRYLTFELGKGDLTGLKKVFNTSLMIHTLIAVLVLILGETIGLWFLYNKMIIPEGRMDAALWVYQCSILSTIVDILCVPYNSTIVAHEKMSAFAYISVLEVVLKLLIVYLLAFFDYDKLKLYALFILAVQLLIRFVYSRYCKKHFLETEVKWITDMPLFKEMLGFASWHIWGTCAYIFYTQGLNIILNMFFGPTVNAARAIAVQVQNATTQLSSNFLMAINPQITKSYAQNDIQRMHELVFSSTRITFILLFFISFPIIVEAPYILKIWLKIVPDHTIFFTRIMLFIVILDSMSQPVMNSVSSTGHVRLYQSIVGGLLLIILPISYIVLKCGGNPESVFIVNFIISCVAYVVRLIIARRIVKISLSQFFHKVILPSLIITVLSFPLAIFIKKLLPNNIISAFIVCLLCVIIVFVFSYTIGINKNERSIVNNRIKKVLCRKIV